MGIEPKKTNFKVQQGETRVKSKKIKIYGDSISYKENLKKKKEGENLINKEIYFVI